jgi:hypothetical protein
MRFAGGEHEGAEAGKQAGGLALSRAGAGAASAGAADENTNLQGTSSPGLSPHPFPPPSLAQGFVRWKPTSNQFTPDATC